MGLGFVPFGCQESLSLSILHSTVAMLTLAVDRIQKIMSTAQLTSCSLPFVVADKLVSLPSRALLEDRHHISLRHGESLKHAGHSTFSDMKSPYLESNVLCVMIHGVEGNI